MYEAFYQFARLPFENTADPLFFYASEQHREALAAIEYTIRMRKGIVLITGDIGAGKTTVGRTTIERCAQYATVGQILLPQDDAPALLRQIGRALDLGDDDAADPDRLHHRLHRFAHEQASRNRPVVLFVDEAQAMSDQALERLRLLTNFDVEGRRLVQLVLLGQPDLRGRIGRSSLAALRQRIFMAKQICPLSVQDTVRYILHRIQQATDSSGDAVARFSADAIRLIYQFSGGVPRVINVMCDNCLLLGYVRQTHRVTAAMVERVRQDMAPAFSDSPHREAASSQDVRRDAPAVTITAGSAPAVAELAGSY